MGFRCDNDQSRRVPDWECERCLQLTNLNGHRCKITVDLGCGRRVCCRCFDHAQGFCPTCYDDFSDSPSMWPPDLGAKHEAEILAVLSASKEPLDIYDIHYHVTFDIIRYDITNLLLNRLRRGGFIRRRQRKGEECWEHVMRDAVRAMFK